MSIVTSLLIITCFNPYIMLNLERLVSNCQLIIQAQEVGSIYFMKVYYDLKYKHKK